MIPAGLPPQFVNWRIENNTKVPCAPDGRKINPHEPGYWMTYEQAAQYGQVGFVLTANDPWWFIDLDKCGDGTAEGWSAEALAVWQSFPGAYGEVSQSNKGLHIIGQADISKLVDRHNRWDGWKEFYVKDRFIALGHGFEQIGTPQPIPDHTNLLLKWVPEREYLGDLPDGVDPSYTGPQDDDRLIQMMLRSVNAKAAFGQGITIAQLWNADVTALCQNFPDEDGGYDASRADQALACHLAFWTGKDMPRIDRLFRRSSLFREKWERDDYRRNTVQNAARLTTSVFNSPPPDKTKAQSVAVGNGAVSEVLLFIPEMIEHFKGCVYVRDYHKVLIPDGSLLKPEQFNATYGGHVFTMTPDGTKPTKKAFEAFTENMVHKFPSAISARLAPMELFGAIKDGRVNIYVAPDYEDIQGDVSMFTVLVEKLYPDARDRAIILSYMAAIVQYPGVKFRWCPVTQGIPGNGKTTLAECLKFAIGRRYGYSPRSSQLGGQFNGYIEHRLLIALDEFHMNGRRMVLDELKPFITDREVERESKGVDGSMIENLANWFATTNYFDAVLTSIGDRRYAVFFTPHESPDDLIADGLTSVFFNDLYKWLEDGKGFEMVAHYLKTYMIPPEFDPSGLCNRAPKTTATDRAVELSRGVIEQEILDMVDSKMMGFKGGWINDIMLREELKHRNQRHLPPVKMGLILSELGYSNQHWDKGRSPRVVIHNGDRTYPVLWYKGDASDLTPEDYLAAQGLG